MTRIESKQVDIAKPAAQVHAFLQDMNNFQQLLPQDRISEWKSDGASGAATIGLKLAGGVPDKEVRMESSERSPFKFTLTVHLDDKGGSTRAWQVFEADLNPFIKMMVESPLKHLFDHIADKMVALHGAA
jgi:carbon monoxide dehydrogenase subunit G